MTDTADELTGLGAELPLSFAQERLWFFHQLQPDSSAYNQAMGLRLQGRLDVAALRAAVSELVARHESLRTTFPAHDGRPYQCIAEPCAVPLPVRTVTEAQRDTLVTGEVREPFGLGDGPLYRWRLYRLDDQEHLLLIVLHHMITDGWSFGVLTTELGALYTAFHRGAGSPLAELPVQYADYALWQREALGGDALAGQLAHWRTELGGMEPLELPTDHPRPPEQTFHGERHWFRLPEPLSRSLLSLARDAGATPFMALVSVFQMLLGRYSGQERLAVGVPVAGRDRAELAGLIGYFVNTLVLCADLSGNPSFRQVLERTRANATRGYRNLDVPLQWVAAELDYQRDLSRNPLFDVMFAWQDVPAREPQMAGLRVSFEAPDTTVNLVDLTLNCYPDDEGILGHLIYNRDLFDPDSIALLAERFVALAEQVVAEPDRRLSRLSLRAGSEPAVAAAAAVPVQATRTVGELIDARAIGSPDAVAVHDHGEDTTYADLTGMADRVANWLRGAGVRPGDVVGVCLPRGVRLIAALLGVLRAGATYLPLDAEHPVARREFMLRDSGARIVLVASDPAPVPPGVRAVPVDDLLEGDHGRVTPRLAPPSPSSPAYLIYTSGSTGTPKAVLVEHAALAARVAWMVDAYALGPTDRVLQFASVCFDTHVEEIYPCLASGAQLVLTDPRSEDLGEVLTTGAGRELTVLDLPTPFWHEVVGLVDSGRIRLPSSLRLVVIGADQADAHAVATWRQRVTARLVNTYGPTEATVVATAADLSAAAADDGVPPIGQPVAGVRAYVLDRALHPVGVGLPGELYLGGTGLARGYLARPGLTSQRFVADPFGSRGTRMYRTGDRVRWRHDGQLEFLGRVDHQVKVRGFRVELGEVEAVLRRHPDVTDAVVVVTGAPVRRLVAYVVGAKPGAVREFAAAHLPEYMVPSQIRALAEIPRTAGGKPDRRALPEPGETPGSRAPQGMLEQALAEVWCEVLRLDQVGAEDNFFELGGDSIVSIQVVARARARGVDITPRQMFRHQTIATLAAACAQASARSPRPPAAAVSGPVPLLPMQRWLLTRPWCGIDHFAQSVLTSVPVQVDAGLLTEALTQLVERHPALRARFTHGPGGWEQDVASPGRHDPVDCAHIDLSGLAAAEASAALTARCVELKSAIAPDRAPLLRAALFTLDQAGPRRLLLAAHHLAVDAVSWHILLEDLAEAYRRLTAGEPPAPPPPGSSVRDQAEQLGRYAASEELRQEAAYWASVCRGRSTPDTGDLRTSRELSLHLTRDETAALLTSVRRVPGSRITDVLLAALTTAWREWTGEAELVVDVEGHGRDGWPDDVELDRTVGWFTALYPVRLSCPDPADTAATVRAVGAVLRRVPRGGLGYGVLRHQLGRLSELPTPPVSFNYLGRFDPAASTDSLFGPAGEDSGPDTGVSGPREHRIEINGGVFDGRLRMAFGYSPQVDAPASLRRLTEKFRQVLIEAADGPAGCAAARSVGTAAADGRSVRYPLSPLQQGLLFHDLTDDAPGQYVVQVDLRLRGRIDVPAARRAWRELATRHPVLRTSVHWVGLAEPVQVVDDRCDIEVTELEGTLEPAQLSEWLTADRCAGFELTRAPLVRVMLAGLSDGTRSMVVTCHHIILDGWSSTRLLAEFFDCYARARSGLPLTAAPTPPFADYLAWLAEQDQSTADRYWRRRLAGFEKPTVFGEAPATPHGSRTDTADVVLTLPADRSARLVEFARREHLTVSTLLHTAWAVVAGRHAGTDDVVFGSTVSGRPPGLAGVERMLGLFINTLPVRIALPVGRAARDVLLRTQEELTELREFEYSSLADVQRLVGLEPGEALFDSILVVENYPAAPSSDHDTGLTVEQVSTREQTSYPLTVAVTVGTELLVRVSYRTDRFDETGASWLAGQLITAVESLAQRPDAAIGRTDLFTGPERRILDQAAGGEPACPAGTLTELLDRQLRDTPHAPAVTFADVTLTYADLHARADSLAEHLRAAGVGPDQVVAVCADRGIALVVSLLAVLRAGGAYLPLDPGYPPARLAHMLEDSAARLLLCEPERCPQLADLAGGRIRLLPVCADGRAQDTERSRTPGPPPGAAGPDDLAYLIYTSGSTGVPKGVANTHRAIANRLVWMQHRYRLTGTDTVLQKTPSSFDVSVWEFFWPLTCGARLVLAEPGGHRDPAYLARVIAAERVSTVHFVPSMLRAFLEQDNPPDCPSLVRVLCSGEELGEPLARRAVDTLGVRVHNLYGPTEAAIDVTSWRYLPEHDSARVPIGRPIPGLRVHLLDRWLRPVPVGAAGEAYLGGIGLARGYLGRPALTAERFVADPFGPPGGRLYRTGDLARRRSDGAIEFLGRTDDQVKLRGFRIELGEVEARLAEHPDVRAAAVAVRTDSAGSGRLVAYLVARGDRLPDAASVRAFTAQALPEYMVPNVVVALPALPSTPSGKLDRAALPTAAPAPDRTAERRAPSGDTESALAAIWRDVLGVPEVGADDDFFDLGGHSLLAMRVIALAAAALPAASAPLTVMDLFTHPTVAGLAALATGDARQAAGLLHRMTPPRTGVRASLICVPYGGGSAAVFKPLADALDERHALYSVALPGHDPGRADEALCPLAEVVARCADEIDADVGGPLVVYGHCLGGSATAVALAQELQRRGREVLAVYVGGSFPSARLPGRLSRRLGRVLPTGRLTGDRSYYNFVRSLGGLTEPLADREMHLLARALRHDSREAEEFFTREYEDGRKPTRLRAPIVSVVADRDPTTDMYPERFREWLHFGERVGLVVLPGADHFFVRGQADRLAEIVSSPPASYGLDTDDAAGTADRAPRGGEPSRRASLRRFSAVTAGELVSQIGSGLTAFAVGLWVYLTTGSLTEFALVEMFATLPGVLLTPLVGAVVDRTSRRRVMAVANATAAVAQAGLAVLAWRGQLGITSIYALLAVVSLAMMFERVAYLSAIPQLAPKRYAFRLNGIVQVAMGLAQVVAPPLAVVVLHRFDITGILAVDAVSFLVLSATLAAVRFPTTRPRTRRESLRTEIAQGFGYVFGRPGLREMLVYFAALSVLTAPVFLLVTPLVLPFGSVGTVGLLLTVAGVGSIAGGLAISLWGGPRRVMAGVLGSSVVGGLAIALVGLRPAVPLIGAALFVYLMSAAVFQGCYATMVQLRVPPLLQGRVFAFVQMVSLGAAPLAYLAAGPLGDRVFEPMMARGGPLAGTVGAVLGTGPGRGVALMYVLSGVAIVVLTVAARRRPALWNLERALPEHPTSPGTGEEVDGD